MTLHEYFTRVAQRFVATLDEATEDGIVWRVDLRLRPEGRAGRSSTRSPRPSATTRPGGAPGSAPRSCARGPSPATSSFGARLLEALAPFVWRRAVDPRIVDEMAALAGARARRGRGDRRGDLKIGPGGIREVEFFVQSLQLVWGGREPQRARARTRSTRCGACARAASSPTARGARCRTRTSPCGGSSTASSSRPACRRTRCPGDRELLERIARSLGFASRATLERDLDARARSASPRGSRSLSREGARAAQRREARSSGSSPRSTRRDEAAVRVGGSRERFGPAASPDLAAPPRSRSRGGPTTRSARRRATTSRSFAPRCSSKRSPTRRTRSRRRACSPRSSPASATPERLRARARRGPARRARARRRSSARARSSASRSSAHPELVDRVLFGARRAHAARARGARSTKRSRRSSPAETARRSRGLRRRAAPRASGRVTMEVGLADLAGEPGHARVRAWCSPRSPTRRSSKPAASR